MDQLKLRLLLRLLLLLKLLLRLLLKLRLNSSSSFQGRGIADFTGREDLRKELVSANLMK